MAVPSGERMGLRRPSETSCPKSTSSRNRGASGRSGALLPCHHPKARTMEAIAANPANIHGKLLLAGDSAAWPSNSSKSPMSRKRDRRGESVGAARSRET